jgi:hypothetical protein
MQCVHVHVAHRRWLLVVAATALAILGVASPALSLPDGRVYELVSPPSPYKSGGIGGVFPLGSLVFAPEQYARSLQASVEGGAVAYVGEDFYQPRLGSVDEYLSQRNAGGWSTTNITPGVPATEEQPFDENLDVGFSPDLSIGVIESAIHLTPDAPAEYANLFLMHGSDVAPLISAKPPNRTPETFGYAYALVVGRFRFPRFEARLLFAGGNAGTGASPTFSHVLFEANDALTPNATDGGKFKNNLYESVNGELRLVNVLPGPGGEADPGASFGVNYNKEYVNIHIPSLDHVISADGSRIFWTDENNHNLYVRENGETTRQVDGSVGGEGQFQTASSDGSRAFFTKASQLYEYDLTDGATHDLAASGVLGVLGASDSGEYVYFVSTSVLAGNAAEGQPNLYLSHAGQTQFIATLSPGDDETPELYGSGGSPSGDWYSTFAGRTAEVSPDGRYVAFLSQKPLTGYDNVSRETGAHLYEIFVYDAATDTLACASCNTDGSPPRHNTLLPTPAGGVYQPRYVDDAGRLFFSTSEPVLPQDTNETSDVYEYAAGRVSLISPGEMNTDAVFADSDETGENVFFTTRQQLVSSDTDRVIDMYDARVGGQAPPPPPAAPCAGEACHGPAVQPPSFEAPVSSVYVGPDNGAATSDAGTTTSAGAAPPVTRPLTRAQKLAGALKACRAKRPRHTRTVCEARARKRYR